MAANSKPRRWVIEVVDGFEPDEFEFIDDAFGGRIADDDDFAVAFEQFVDGLDDDGLGRIEGAQWFAIIGVAPATPCFRSTSARSSAAASHLSSKVIVEATVIKRSSSQ